MMAPIFRASLLRSEPSSRVGFPHANRPTPILNGISHDYFRGKYLSNLERGRGNPTIDALRSLADALDLEVGELVGGDGSGEALDTSLLVLADAPSSLGEFTRSSRFDAVARRLATRQGLDIGEMRTKLMVGMASAPRRSQGEPTSEDWRRLLDVYSVILADE
jgi:transcriptional regulator with XRE-family HTH domain